MSVTAVVGVQIGDEAKGKFVDYLVSTEKVDMVIRGQGGPNAGHTVVNQYGESKLHSVPSGIFDPKVDCIIGPGTVFNPAGLVEELNLLIEKGVDIGRLRLSDRSHLIMPYHPVLDGLEDAWRSGSGDPIGTTKQGVGPAYADKMARRGFQACELTDLSSFQKKLSKELEWKNQILGLHGHPPMNLDEIMAEIEAAAAFLQPLIGDTLEVVWEAIAEGKHIVMEGQLGAMKCLDMGTYPFVTSSNPTVAGLCNGCGIAPGHVKRVIGVMKGYTTAVGAGPFPTEIKDEIGALLQQKGNEFGATTKRPRQCGWFDAVAVEWACQLNGVTELALAKIDVFSGISPLKICTGYGLDGKLLTSFPMTKKMGLVTPIYEEMPGWTEDISQARSMDELPINARSYVSMIQQRVGVPIRLISVGPEREATFERQP